MKILIVEDDDYKSQELSDFFSTATPKADLSLAKSLHSGIRLARNSNFDLVILDMTLPNFDISQDEHGGQTHAYGGETFLKQMSRYGFESKVVVVTQFEILGLEELDLRLKKQFPLSYLGLVHYNIAIDSWKEKLLTLIDTYRKFEAEL